jgi:hypothetical protein
LQTPQFMDGRVSVFCSDMFIECWTRNPLILNLQNVALFFFRLQKPLSHNPFHYMMKLSKDRIVIGLPLRTDLMQPGVEIWSDLWTVNWWNDDTELPKGLETDRILNVRSSIREFC